MATIDDFVKIEMRVGKILAAEKVEGADKLLRLTVDFSNADVRQVISGIALDVTDPATLVGLHVGFITNLEPRMIRGFESKAMIMAGRAEDGRFSLIGPFKDLPPGTLIK